MALPKEPGIRRPAVAGRFYPADPSECRAWAKRFVDAGKEKFATGVTKRIDESAGALGEGSVIDGRSPRGDLSGGDLPGGDLPGGDSLGKSLLGGIVPHAGWICSGAIAGETIGALVHARPDADLIVVFGAIHTPIAMSLAALDSYAKWIEPSGESQVVEDVRAGLREDSNRFVVDDRFHLHEHAVEVELPLIEMAWPGAAILPIEVPLAMNAMDIGIATARRVKQMNRRAVFLASSDLTHYGPDYRFAPAGIGTHGLQWAKENDRRLLEQVEKFAVEQVVSEVATRQNACGGGAIAAMLAACREFGAKSAQVLRHANSFETLKDVAPQRPDNAVGYAAVIVQ